MGHRDEGKGGEEGFRARYWALFGARWPPLEAALARPPDSRPFEAADGSAPYYMDSASIFAAQSLEFEPDARVLDACAAPGGKSLVLASRLGAGGSLFANELSAERRRRLREVLDAHLPTQMRSRVSVGGRDAAAMCRSFESAFDAILLDAPCSSERHVLSDPAALAKWSPARARFLAQRQWSLLSAALIMLKEGGCLVYSTCSLSPEENEGVVERAAARYGSALSFEAPRYEGSGESLGSPGESVGRGLMILPDKAGGAGPMYVCRMRKARARQFG
jgi:16S rRNA (cytosine1407-C5)-methyltransferase